MNIVNLCSVILMTISGYYGQSQKVIPQTRLMSNEIPLELIQQINDVENITNFMERFLVEPYVTRVGLSADYGDALERKAVISAKMANCMPENQTVELRPPADESLFYFPPCTRVERCGGCCSHSLLSCQPSETQIVHFQVVVTEYAGGNQLRYYGKEIIPVEKHTKCKCDCKIKKEDCNAFQEYSKSACRCLCTNKDAEVKCYEQENDKKIWDPSKCACTCREQEECSTGFYFDSFQCQCLAIRGNKKKQGNRNRISPGYRLTYSVPVPIL